MDATSYSCDAEIQKFVKKFFRPFFSRVLFCSVLFPDFFRDKGDERWSTRSTRSQCSSYFDLLNFSRIFRDFQTFFRGQLASADKRRESAIEDDEDEDEDRRVAAGFQFRQGCRRRSSG